jgi:hypothetical protein
VSFTLLSGLWDWGFSGSVFSRAPLLTAIAAMRFFLLSPRVVKASEKQERYVNTDKLHTTGAILASGKPAHVTPTSTHGIVMGCATQHIVPFFFLRRKNPGPAA